jgi:hypothetical protein
MSRLANIAGVLEEDIVRPDGHPVAVLEINDAIDRLAKIDRRLVRVVEHRFYGGLAS